jgi:hypothetical protein
MNKLEIERLALFSCKRADRVLEKKWILSINELREINKELENVFRDNITGTIRSTGILNSPLGNTARIHNFSSDSVRSICEKLLDPSEDFESNTEQLARKYYDTKRSQGAAIFIFVIRMPPNSFVIVYSSEYIKDIASFSNEKIIETLRDVFSRGLKKGIVYPYITPSGDLQDNRAKVFQRGHYAEYWWRFFDLEKELSNKEILIRTFFKDEEERKASIQFNLAYVRNIATRATVTTKVPVTIIIDGVEIELPFGGLYDTVIPAIKDGEKRIVIIGDPSFKLSSNQFREIKEYRDYDRI